MAKKKNRTLHPDEPLLHPDHSRPVTRREFVSQGFIAGTGAVLAPSLLGMLASTRQAHALSSDLDALKAITECNIVPGADKIPFICFDLAGGANFAGSNVLVGGQAGIEDSLTSAGYSKLGIPGDRLPDFATNAFVNRDLGIPFHSESSMLAGIKMRFTNTTEVNGAVIPARSDNDTGNNPHNPMYGINKAGARGELLTLIGSRNSVSGGNSMSPASMIDLSVRPTKIDRPSDTQGLVDTGELAAKMGLNNATRVMESIQRVSSDKLFNANVQTGLNDIDPDTSATYDAGIKKQANCAYVKSADMVENFGDPTALDSSANDPDIAQVFSAGDLAGDGEFRKTAAVMKMVLKGYAGAGTITMGGYDYHTGNRTTGDARDLRAGQCIGACLRYAEILGKPLMIYVCSDGSLSSNGTPDAGANGKLVWTSDNSSTACSFFLVYKPGGRPVLFTSGSDSFTAAQHQQLGWFRSGASVETNATPAANNVNLLVETVILNYMALHGEIGQFASKFPNHGLGNNTMLDRMTAFEPIVNGTASNII
ncbi:MAG: general secretion pathway protein GspF [Gammaproteobacteria bacterium]|nr:general secretion pathway protein GspF [Gammaproteobacteria bacterium]MCW8986529.1 general secretion pathway protein GspF [Gammaproteobacteria bacterium]